MQNINTQSGAIPEIISAGALAAELAAHLSKTAHEPQHQPQHQRLAHLLEQLNARTPVGQRLAPAVLYQCASLSEHPCLTERNDDTAVKLSLARVLDIHDPASLEHTMLRIDRGGPHTESTP